MDGNNSSPREQPWLVWSSSLPLLLMTLLLIRMVFVVCVIRKHRTAAASFRRFHACPTAKHATPIKTLVVLGSGGHTTEILALVEKLNPQVYKPLVYMVASSDETSVQRLVVAQTTRPLQQQLLSDSVISSLPRAREVGQSYVTSVFTTCWSLLVALWLVTKVRPTLVLCNGPGTCVPVVVATLCLRILGLAEGNLVFVESVCRVQSLSLTGRLLYPIADLFVVHWQELQNVYPNCLTVSTFVQNNNNDKAHKEE